MSGGTVGVRGGTAAECRKFAPNIFNKSKCSSCFKQKEEHSAEALECNRATRKISKCGYLFVAPGWDFSNPLNRTKRWQRRWFVLYDDGELTYSVDEHPETVPQSRIDMTRVLEVAAAEDVTGHPNSLAITSPEGVTFVKGTCREETRWWADVLQVYSRNKGRHKRNATFPGGQTTILQVTPTIRSNTPNPPRPRFNSCRSEPTRTGSNPWLPETTGNGLSSSSRLTAAAAAATADVLSNGVADVPASSTRNENGLNAHSYLTSASGYSTASQTALTAAINGANTVANVYTNMPAIGSNVTAGYVSSSATAPTVSLASTLADKPPMIPNDVRQSTTAGNAVSLPPTTTSSSVSSSSSSTNTNSNVTAYRDQPASSASPPTRDKLRAEDKARRRMNQQAERRGASIQGPDEKLEDDACRRILLEHEREREGKLRDIAASLTQPRVRRSKPRISEPTRDVVDAANAAHRDKLIRGDPDGCGLDMPVSRYSPTSELRVDLPAEDLLNIKKGWLMKQSANKEWNKHWFVLRGCGLMYYRDPCAEDKGIMDGVIDLNTVTAVTSLQVARNYGFQTVAWDERGNTVLSAVTAGIRASWMAAIRRAANLPEVEETENHASSMQDNQQEANPQSPTASITDRESSSALPSASVTPRSVLFSSDEEYRTASEGGRRESGDWSELPVSPPLTSRNGTTDWPVPLKLAGWSADVGSAAHEWSELPPSPPLTRTALSRVKARSRSSSRSRVYKRSRSSPPSSRRSTLDSVGSEDLVMACCELRDEDERNDTRPRNNECLPNADEDEALRKNPLIVDLLESQVTLLRDHLEQSQSQPSALLVIVERQASEIESLRSQLNATRTEVLAAEKELSRLRQQKAEAAIREKQLEEMLAALQRSEQQRTKDIEDLEKMKKLNNRDKESLECKLLETETILRESSERCEVLTNELASSHRTVEHLQNEVDSLSDRLSRGIEENERLYNKVRELEGKGSLSAARERGRSFDSLSDLTNIDLDLDLNTLDKERIMEEYDELRSRFEKAILEIRAMRKELREAHATQDALELEIISHKQSAASASETNASQTRLMAARIQDLTSKLGASEKQARALRQKLTKAETRDKRRSLSLKGREAMQISQEVEEKLADLENKVRAIEAGRSSSAPPPLSVGSSKESSPNTRKEKKRDAKSLDRNRVRRKSLDSVTGNEPIKFLIRLNNLETRVANVAENNSDVEKDSSECSEVSASSASEVSTEVLCRLRKLERAVARSKRRLEKCLGSTQAEDKAEKCLREVNEILEGCTDAKRGQTQIPDTMGVLVARLEGILTEKLVELASRRRALAEAGELNERAKTRLLAERMAYETVALSHLKSAASRATAPGNALLAELAETSQLVAALRRKVRGAARTKPGPGPMLVHSLAGVLADRIEILTGSGTSEKSGGSAMASENSMFLMRKQKEADEIVRSYKESKLKALADALASETLDMAEQEDQGNNRQSCSSGKKLLEDRRIREAWAVAQETVSKELVQLEVFNVITRCGEMYEQSVGTIADVCLSQQATPLELESWIDEAQARLRQEMEASIRELSEAYEEAIRARKTRRASPDKKDARIESRDLLMEYADVIAHKALIDARISLLREGTRETIAPGIPAEGFVSSLLRNEDLLASLAGEDEGQGNGFEDPVRNAEYVYLYRKFARDCEDRVSGRRGSKEQLRNVGQALAGLEDDLDGLAMNVRAKNGLNVDAGGSRNGNTSTPSDWSSVCEKCAHLRARIKEISAFVESSSCGQCAHLQETIERMTREHSEELESLKRSQEKDLMDIKAELDSQRHSLTTQYEQEAASLRERARKLEQRLNAMDSEHSAHVNELRAAYQRSISAELDTDAETRKRYKEEIKQLRALCEKGLLAMENSHRRMIADMEEKHRQELENLRVEKEQALSEETQATLAALDAMRKAHEHEVQKEIAKFKQEFVKQVQAREDIGTLHKEHEEEMEEIKREILSLSAKYSSKCVESAALEEKVGGLAKQLSQAQQHIMQLDARNKQLRAQLLLEASENGDAMEVLRGRDNEIAEQRDEIHRLQQQLKHGESSLDARPVKDAEETSPCVRAPAAERGERDSRGKEADRDGQREKGDNGKSQAQGNRQKEVPARETGSLDSQGHVQTQGNRQRDILGQGSGSLDSQGHVQTQGNRQRDILGQGAGSLDSQGHVQTQGNRQRDILGQGSGSLDSQGHVQTQGNRQRDILGQGSGSLDSQGHVQTQGNRQRDILGQGSGSLDSQGHVQTQGNRQRDILGQGSGSLDSQVPAQGEGQVSLRGPSHNPIQGSRGILSTDRKSLSADRPTSSGFSYRLERLKSISLPYASTLLPSGKPRERNGLGGPLWDSLRPRSGLPQQYQGGTAEMRLGGGGGPAGRAQEGRQQNEERQQQRQQRAELALASRLTPEPPTLSVAELMRSPAVRWSSRSCRSLPPTPTPSYHHPLHPPLPAVGMVAERKKRFEL